MTLAKSQYSSKLIFKSNLETLVLREKVQKHLGIRESFSSSNLPTSNHPFYNQAGNSKW